MQFSSTRALATTGAICLLTLFSAGLGRAADAPNPMTLYSKLIGEWVSATEQRSMRVTYEWGVNERMVRSKSYLLNEGGEKNVYESTLYWHPDKRKAQFVSVSSTGGIFEGTVEAIDNRFEFEWVSFRADGASTSYYRQTILLENDDTYTWLLKRKNTAGEWEQVFQDKFKRQKK